MFYRQVILRRSLPFAVEIPNAETEAAIDQAIEEVASVRGDLGAIQNRLDFSIGFTESEIESITSSDASIRDADIAREVTEFARNQVLVEASNAMLVQVNVTSIGVLSLL